MAVVGLGRERRGVGIANAQLVDEGGAQNLRVVERGAVGRQLRVLDAGDERAEIEAGGGLRRRRQAAVRLALRRVEPELAIVEPDEERVVVRQPVVDAAGERVVGDLPVGRRDVVVEVAAAVVRQRVDARDVPADGENAVLRNDVVGKLIAHDPPRRRVDTGGERIVNRDQVAVAIAIVAEVAGARGRRRNGIHRRHAARLPDAGVVGEEERAAVAVVEARDHHRAADRAAELMPIERRHRILDQRPVRSRPPCGRKSCARRRRRCAGTRSPCREAGWCPTWSTRRRRPRRVRTRRRRLPRAP